jgi:hypothetical protein
MSGPLSFLIYAVAGCRNMAFIRSQLLVSTAVSQPLPHAPADPHAGLFSAQHGEIASIVKSPAAASQKSGDDAGREVASGVYVNLR